MIIISDTLVRFFLVTTVSATILCGSVHGLEWKAANVDTANMDPTHNGLTESPMINTLPVERTLDGIFLVEEETISVGPGTWKPGSETGKPGWKPGNRGQMKVFTLTKTTISLYFNLIVKTFI